MPPTYGSRRGCPTPTPTTTTSWPKSSASFSFAPRAPLAVGIPPDRIVLDAGLDLGKTANQSLLLLQSSARLASLGYPLLLSASNKTFLGVLLELEIGERRNASLASAALGIAGGCRLVRVHDVAGTCKVRDLLAAIIESAPEREADCDQAVSRRADRGLSRLRDAVMTGDATVFLVKGGDPTLVDRGVEQLLAELTSPDAALGDAGARQSSAEGNLAVAIEEHRAASSEDELMLGPVARRTVHTSLPRRATHHRLARRGASRRVTGRRARRPPERTFRPERARAGRGRQGVARPPSPRL